MFSSVEEVAGSQMTNTAGSFGQIKRASWNNLTLIIYSFKCHIFKPLKMANELELKSLAIFWFVWNN